MKKSELKTGMVVELKNGNRRIIFEGLLLDKKLSICNTLNSCDENLLREDRAFSELDIVKVYENINILALETEPPIWVRGEVKSREVTSKEIEVEFIKFCSIYGITCKGCKYSKELKEYCRISWILDNYNLTRKEVE